MKHRQARWTEEEMECWIRWPVNELVKCLQETRGTGVRRLKTKGTGTDVWRENKRTRLWQHL